MEKLKIEDEAIDSSFNEFWSENEKQILASIQEFDNIDIINKWKSRNDTEWQQIQGNNWQEKILTKEKNFCRLIINKIEKVLKETDYKKIFLYFDLDNVTLYPETSIPRPSSNILAKFLKEKFNIELGFLSGEKTKAIKQRINLSGLENVFLSNQDYSLSHTVGIYDSRISDKASQDHYDNNPFFQDEINMMRSKKDPRRLALELKYHMMASLQEKEPNTLIMLVDDLLEKEDSSNIRLINIENGTFN